MDAPLIQLARSDERKTTTSATSKSVPSRCAGNSRVRNISYASGVSFWKRSQPPPGKRSEPGQTVLTRMLWSASSHASAPARNISAALVAPYCAPRFAGFQPEMEEMVTMLPPSLFFMWGNRRAAGANRVKEVEVKGLLPVGVCGGEEFARSRCAAHIVDEDINAAECICGCIDKSLGFAGFGYVERESECLDAVCANFFACFVYARLPARAEGDVATFCGKSQCGCAPIPRLPPVMRATLLVRLRSMI